MSDVIRCGQADQPSPVSDSFRTLQIVSTLLDAHDWADIAQQFERADALGPILDPTLYRDAIADGNYQRWKRVIAATRTYVATLHEAVHQ